MNCYQADLHIHTVLSPCAHLLMTPGNIIKKAREQGLDIIAITDHNSGQNVRVTLELARNTPLHVFPGMEVESAEEVHLLCLFDRLDDLLEWQEIVFAALPDQPNDEEYFGEQLITDLDDQYVAREERLLATATKLTVKKIVKMIAKIGGLVIPSHIDRPYNSILANLGIIPQDLELTILELSARQRVRQFLRMHPYLKKYAFIQNSDSHFLTDIKPMTKLCLEEINLTELRMAAANQAGRKIMIQ